ncbi:hypothetical protein AAHE18_15G183500 [Arachis hypogaea]
MSQPFGFEQDVATHVCKLNKSLYGLKQALREWFLKLSTTLQSFGFQSTKSDINLFIKRGLNYLIYILCYVDDIIMTSNDAIEIDNMILKLHNTFTLKDLGPLSYFLGIEVHWNNTSQLHLSQTKYITDLLSKLGMSEASAMLTPMISALQLLSTGSERFEDLKLFRFVVGILQYITITRPDLSYDVSKVSQFMHSPLLAYGKAVKRILQYLQGTKHHGFVYLKCTDYRLYIFSDLDWAADLEDRRSVSSYCVFLGTNLISGSCKKQTTISRSSTEAKFRSLAACETKLVWIRNLLLELQIEVPTVLAIYCDNLSIVLLTANPVLHTKTKHFQLDIQFVRDKVNSKQPQIVHILGIEQIVDMLTKPLSTSSFERLKTKLRVVFRHNLSLKRGIEDIKGKIE